MKVFITGGTGFIGQCLVTRLAGRDCEVIAVTRGPRDSTDRNIRYVSWNAQDIGDWAKEVDGCDAVINLVGEGIFEKRWTAQIKQHILDSRIETTGLVVEAIKNSKVRPKVLVSASAVGFYGDTKEMEVTEKSPPGEDFLADVCIQWEEEARRAAGFDVRVAHPRIGVVLGKDGGALKQMLPPFRAFLGGPLGSGMQWFPWVHIDDVVDAILFPLIHKDLDGPYNVAAPEVMRMKEFCAALGKVLHRPSWLAVPPSILKLMAGEAADCLLQGQKISSRKLEQAGFKFRYPKLEEALRSIID